MNVSDMERSLTFFRERLGFKVIRRTTNFTSLGAGTTEIIQLEEAKIGNGNAFRDPHTSRLYHFAVRVPSRLALAQVINQLQVTGTPLQGFADHLVSEAVYLSDLDGNGIEIYRDRPRDQWPREADGRLKMATEPLDLEGVLSELGEVPARPFVLDPATRMGHIHLHVEDLEVAVGFYRDALGFDLVLRYGPSAAFLSAGSYHHHIGLNTWVAVGSAPPPEGALGMVRYVIEMPDQPSMDNVANNLRTAQVDFQTHDNGLIIRDPSGNEIKLSVK